MANFNLCLAWTLKFEDPKGEYEKIPDVGGFAIAGVNSFSFPSEFADIVAVSPKFRPPLVESFYQKHFWNKWLEQIDSDESAKRIFDAGVNMGAGTAARLAQEAAGCDIDGAWGPNTVTAINAEGEAIVQVFKEVRSAHYEEIVAKNPDRGKFLNGWLARARA